MNAIFHSTISLVKYFVDTEQQSTLVSYRVLAGESDLKTQSMEEREVFLVKRPKVRLFHIFIRAEGPFKPLCDFIINLWCHNFESKVMSSLVANF